MTEPVRSALRVTAGTGLLAALLLGVHVRASDPQQGALLRVALRTSAGTGQVCRRVSEAELAATPVHMRRAEICETHAVPYRLDVRSGATVLLDRTFEASGLRGDRPLTVNEDIVMPAGLHDVTIRFAPVATLDPPPQVFEFAGPVEFPEGRIRVATTDATGTRLEIR